MQLSKARTERRHIQGTLIGEVGNAESSAEVETVEGVPDARGNAPGNLNTLAVLREQDFAVQNLSAGEKMNAAKLYGRVRQRKVQSFIERLLINPEWSWLAPHPHGSALRVGLRIDPDGNRSSPVQTRRHVANTLQFEHGLSMDLANAFAKR